MDSQSILFNQVKIGLDKIEKNLNSHNYVDKIEKLVESFVKVGITEIPQFDNVDDFISEVNSKDSVSFKIDNILSLPENIKHQTGRGELSMLLMVKNSRKSNVKNETGDVTLNNKSYELKKESGIIDFAIKTRGKVTDSYNELVTIRSLCDKILNTYFIENYVTNYFNNFFRKKITEFSNKDFKHFSYVLELIKNDENIKNNEVGNFLIKTIGNFSVQDWRKNVAKIIIESYSGGVVVYRKFRKGNRKVKPVESKYELLNVDNVIVQNLTLGNIQLKIIN